MKAIRSDALSPVCHSSLPDGTRCGFCLALLSAGLQVASTFYHSECWPFVLASQGQSETQLPYSSNTDTAGRPYRGMPSVLKHPWLRS